MVLKVSVCVTETHKRGNKRREEEELIHKTEEIMLNIPTVFTKILHTCKLLLSVSGNISLFMYVSSKVQPGQKQMHSSVI